MIIDRRLLDRGRRLEDCSPLPAVCLFMVYGACVGFLVGYMARAWLG